MHDWGRMIVKEMEDEHNSGQIVLCKQIRTDHSKITRHVL